MYKTVKSSAILEGAMFIQGAALNSLINMEFFLFFLRKFSQLHALLKPPRLLDIFPAYTLLKLHAY